MSQTPVASSPLGDSPERESTDAARPTGAPALRRIAIGLIAGVAGVGLGHLVASAIEPEASPVLAVGSGVIDLTPQPVKAWAIEQFGTNDKIFLLTVVGLVAAVACGLAGYLNKRSTRPGSIVVALVGLICAFAAMTRPVATVLSVIPSVVTAAVAAFVLHKLFAATRDNVSPATDNPSPSRRQFLAFGGAAAGVGIAALAAGQYLITSAKKAASFVLPKPATPIAALPAGLESKVPGLSPFRTPNVDFYRIDTALTVPTIDAESWTLTIDGDVDNPVTLSLNDLMNNYEVIERDITMTCVSNPVGGEYIGSSRWLGVRVSDVLKDVGIRGGVDQILSQDVDGMTISTPIEALTDDREAMLAFGMDGEVLPREHGFPVRLVTPGLYGFVGATKWISQMTATTYAKQQAYWTERDWVIDGTIETQTRIDLPKPFQPLTAGKATYIAGVAWAQGRGISAVELKINDGEWMPVTLGPEANIYYWRQWYYEWTPEPGKYTLQVRAIDGNGDIQTADRANPYPGAATGQQSFSVTAS